jgi:hypothetical protein
MVLPRSCATRPAAAARQPVVLCAPDLENNCHGWAPGKLVRSNEEALKRDYLLLALEPLQDGRNVVLGHP